MAVSRGSNVSYQTAISRLVAGGGIEGMRERIASWDLVHDNS